ncbi:MAG: hypothetical protein ACYDHH_04210 [Solirubrobacteraceae bacterium]
MRRIRVLAAGAPGAGWPGYVSWRLFQERFEIVERDPDLVLLQVMDDYQRWMGVDLGPSQRAAELGLPVVALEAMDAIGTTSEWDRRWLELRRRADLVVGPQLPRELGARGVPLLYPPRQRFVGRGPYLGCDAPIELSFVGAYTPCSATRWPEDERSREWRGAAIQRLCDGLHGHRIEFQRADYWQSWGTADDRRLEQMHIRYARVMARSAVIFCPPGLGYNTTRHTEAWRQRRLVLSAPVHERVMMPEPELWREEALGVHFRWDGSDLVDRCRWAIDNASALAERVAEGHAYYLRWGTAQARLDQIDHAFRRLLA